LSGSHDQRVYRRGDRCHESRGRGQREDHRERIGRRLRAPWAMASAAGAVSTAVEGHQYVQFRPSLRHASSQRRGGCGSHTDLGRISSTLRMRRNKLSQAATSLVLTLATGSWSPINRALARCPSRGCLACWPRSICGHIADTAGFEEVVGAKTDLSLV
jgi:hypothetical protein